MRDRMERFVLLPFSVGCISESSIAVAIQSRKSSTTADHKSSFSSSSSSSSAIRKREEDEESLSSNENMKSSSTFRFLAISKPDISTGFHRLFKRVKTFTQLFVYKEEEIEEMEKEIEIGFPTDVKHVTHIGIDGSSSSSSTTSNNNPINGWQDLMTPSVSLEQFDLAMASQQNHLLNKDSNN